MDFSSTLVLMRIGTLVHRRVWRGKAHMYLSLNPTPSEFRCVQTDTAVESLWEPQHADLVATDWEVFEVPKPAPIETKPPTQGIVAAGFDAHGAMGAAPIRDQWKAGGR